MNIRGTIKYLFILIASSLSFIFMLNNNLVGYQSIFNEVFILNFVVALTLFITFNRKKNNSFLNITYYLLVLISTAFIIYFLYSKVECVIQKDCAFNNSFGLAIFPALMFSLLFLNIKDIYSKTNKINDYLVIAVSIIFIIIHLRYYFEFTKYNIIDQYKSEYVIGNYIYFLITYIILFIHKWLNKEKSKH